MAMHKVVWQEGMLLRPQHFQQNDRYYDYQLKTRTQKLDSYAWGFFELEIDRQFLNMGKLVVSKASGILPDGTLFDIGFDFHEVGLLAGRVAGDVLKGADPATIPIGETARSTPPRLTVNLEAPGYDRARWRVPEAILRQAKVVIGPDGRRDQPEAVLEGPFDEPHDPAVTPAR